jgi:RNA ligase (TIGR02306 family)
MSTFTVPVVTIGETQKHPNADTLSLTEAEGNPVVFKTGGLKSGDAAVYVPIEAVVPLSHPAFADLETKEGRQTHRVKAKKLRGIFSMGILYPTSILPLDLAWQVGDDVAGPLGIVKYEEPEANMRLGSHRERQPDSQVCPVYDIESARKYRGALILGERVIVSEKIHGCNSRMVYRHDPREEAPRLYVSSHRYFVKDRAEDVFWMAARKYDMAAKLAQIPDLVVYGEVYGKVQDLKYGSTLEDPIHYAAFDIYDSKAMRYLDYEDFKRICTELQIPMVPILYDGPFDWSVIEPLALGNSVLTPTQIREGFVMRLEKERWDPKLGRVIVKLVGEQYHLRKGGTEFQ